MVEGEVHDKVMDAREAVKRFICDGQDLASGNFLHAIPYALMHEIIRQRKRNLTFWLPSAIDEIDLLLAGGCVKRVVTSYSHRAFGLPTELDRALNEGRVEVEDYTNFTLLARFKAGAMGYPFMPVLHGVKLTDIYRMRSFLGKEKFGEVECPFTGRKVLVVPPVNPDVAIVHVQRVDEQGNAQLWGSAACAKWVCFASKRVIVSAEEIVDSSVIKRTPNYTIVPGFKVDAVVEEPWGAHPNAVLGYYGEDEMFRGIFYISNADSNLLRAFMDEWIYGVESRQEYVKKYVERFGFRTLQRLKAKTRMSESVNFGVPSESYWSRGYCSTLDVAWDEFESLLKELGMVVK